MTMSSSLLEELKDSKEYRAAFVAAHVGDEIALQLRALREERSWDQKELAARLGKTSAQPMISRYESADYGRYSVATLLELANAFDVGLIVKFAPFSEMVRNDSEMYDSSLSVPSFNDELEAGAFDVNYSGISFSQNVPANIDLYAIPAIPSSSLPMEPIALDAASVTYSYPPDIASWGMVA